MASPSTFDEETASKVLRQVEFYFSDSNLPRDGFLTRTINESEDGLVSLALICSFSRMKSHLGLENDTKAEDISEDTLKAVAETLRPSTLLKLSEDGKRVGRISEIAKPEQVIEQVDNRTIAASPLEYDVNREDIESFFSTYGKVNSVRLPRLVGDKRYFCGTALVEFSNEEDSNNVLKQSLTYGGVELELKPKKDFDAEREMQTLEFENSSVPTNNGDSTTVSSYPKGLIVAFKLTHKPDEEPAEANGNHPTTGKEEAGETKKASANDSEAKPMDDGKDSEVGGDSHTEDAIVAQETEEKSTVGEKSSAKFDKDDKELVLREDLKAVFQRFGTVKYVDFSMGEESGFIRFEEPEAAQKARAAAVLLENGLAVKNYFATLEPVTGDAEKEYWGKLRDLNGRNNGKNFRGGRGGRNNRGGRHFSGKNYRGRDNDYAGGRPNKSQKVAAT